MGLVKPYSEHTTRLNTDALKAFFLQPVASSYQTFASLSTGIIFTPFVTCFITFFLHLMYKPALHTTQYNLHSRPINCTQSAPIHFSEQQAAFNIVQFWFWGSRHD